MLNDFDLSHINKQIQRNTTDAEAARRRADNRRMMSAQKSQSGDESGSAYHDQEALRFDQQADKLEDELKQLQTSKEQTVKRITELEGEREKLNNEYTTKLSQIDKELTRLRGSSALL